jgi:hypothetical protein
LGGDERRDATLSAAAAAARPARNSYTAVSGSTSVAASAAAASVPAAAAQPALPSPAALLSAATEVELVFRRPGMLASNAAVEAAEGCAARLLRLLESVCAASTRLGAERQTVFAYLARLLHVSAPPPAPPQSAYDAHDGIAAAASAAAAAAAAAAAVCWPAADAALGGRDAAMELAGCVGELRSAVRIKVQDNADLELALRTLRTTHAFFRQLRQLAAARGCGAAEALAQLREPLGA